MRAILLGELRTAQEIPGIINVLRHGASRVFRVSRPYRGVDSAMKRERTVLRDASGKLAHAHHHRTMDAFKKKVADSVTAGTKDRFMKSQVRVQALAYGLAALHGEDGIAQRGQVFSGSAFSCTRCEFRFHHEARFKQFMLRKVIEEHQEVNWLIENGFSAPAQIGTIPNMLREDAHDLEHLQGLPD